MESLNDLALKRLGRSLSYRARAGEPADSLLIESFAATREAGRRRLGMRHYDVQLLAGIALVHGAIVEMQTGEGKTSWPHCRSCSTRSPAAEPISLR